MKPHSKILIAITMVGAICLGVWLRVIMVASGQSAGAWIFNILFKPVGWLYDWYFAPAILFASCHFSLLALGSHDRVGARRVVLGVALLWLGYAVYEWRMRQWEHTVTAPIRLDLVLFAPLLYAIFIVGLIAFWRAIRSPNAPNHALQRTGIGGRPASDHHT